MRLRIKQPALGHNLKQTSKLYLYKTHQIKASVHFVNILFIV